MDARLQIKLNISEYYVRFNKATIGNMECPSDEERSVFPLRKKKTENNTFWIAERLSL